MTTWKWVIHEGATLENIGVNPDGSLHNPNGYPDETVRAAVAAAEQRRRQSYSKAAKKAAETKQRRQEKRVYETVQRIGAGERFGPRSHCVICKRGLDDPQSIQRGIGSECWQSILDLLAATA